MMKKLVLIVATLLIASQAIASTMDITTFRYFGPNGVQYGPDVNVQGSVDFTAGSGAFNGTPFGPWDGPWSVAVVQTWEGVTGPQTWDYTGIYGTGGDAYLLEGEYNFELSSGQVALGGAIRMEYQRISGIGCIQCRWQHV